MKDKNLFKETSEAEQRNGNAMKTKSLGKLGKLQP